MIAATHSFSGVDIVLVVVVVILLAASSVLALAETSLVRTSRVKAHSLVDDGRRGAKTLARLVEHPERFLNPILLLVLVCQLVSATLVGILADQVFGTFGVLVGTVFELVVIFVLTEAVPKNWAVHNPERSALLAAPLVSALVRFPPIRVISGALIGLANWMIGRSDADESDSSASNVTESELRAMADVAEAHDVIEQEERTFIHAIIDFGDSIVREVMVPRVDMVAIEESSTVDDAIEEALSAGFSRVPVYRHSVDDVVGLAYVKDLVRAERQGQGSEPVSGLMRATVFVPETNRLSALLRQMQSGKFHLAMVVDEYGGTAGLVTLEDLIEELVGEIVDEFDVEAPTVSPRPDGEFVVSGRTSLSEVDELLGAELPTGGWDSIAGLVLDLAGGIPTEGQAVEVEGFRLIAQKVQGRRIEEVLIVPQPREDDTDG